MSDERREKVADIFTKAEYGFPFNSLIDHSRERMLNSTDAAIALVRAEQADRIAQLEAALQRIDRIEVYEADAAVVLWAKIGIMRDIACAALGEERT